MNKRQSKWSTRYPEKLTHKDILAAVDEGAYEVDLDTVTVRGRCGKELYTWPSGRSPNLWVRLYRDGKQLALPRAHLVWIVGTRSAVPEGWEIHHQDTNPTNDAFTNLYCLHPVDHLKTHDRYEPEEVPF